MVYENDGGCLHATGIVCAACHEMGDCQDALIVPPTGERCIRCDAKWIGSRWLAPEDEMAEALL